MTTFLIILCAVLFFSLIMTHNSFGIERQKLKDRNLTLRNELKAEKEKHNNQISLQIHDDIPKEEPEPQKGKPFFIDVDKILLERQNNTNEKVYTEKEYNAKIFEFAEERMEHWDRIRKMEYQHKNYVKKLRNALEREPKEGFEQERTFSFYLSETDIGHRQAQIRKRCEEGDEVIIVAKNNKKSIDENWLTAYCHEKPIGTVPPEVLRDVLFFVLFNSYSAYIQYIGQDEFGYQVQITLSYNYKFYE